MPTNNANTEKEHHAQVPTTKAPLGDEPDAIPSVVTTHAAVTIAATTNDRHADSVSKICMTTFSTATL